MTVWTFKKNDGRYAKGYFEWTLEEEWADRESDGEIMSRWRSTRVGEEVWRRWRP